MTEQSMVEKIARAICAEISETGYDGLPETATYLERKTHADRAITDRQEARDIARSVIEQMREPTEAMIATAAWEDGEYIARTVWGQMIDAALAEKEAE